MKNSQQEVTTIQSVWCRWFVASGFIALTLFTPLANAEKTAVVDADLSVAVIGSGDVTSPVAPSTAASAPVASVNTIVIGGPSGVSNLGSAAGSSSVTTIVIQEQTIASPYR